MTGEITLSGNVLPVGGIKENSWRRSGLRAGRDPADGLQQQVDEDLTPDQIAGVKIHYATRIEDVLAVALPKTYTRTVANDE